MNRYREHREKLLGIRTVNQHDVDLLLYRREKEIEVGTDLPKGIDAITLKKICRLIESIGNDGINAEQAGKKIGVSRTTSRRYLEYLVASGALTADLFYGTLGRPERKYFRRRS